MFILTLIAIKNSSFAGCQANDMSYDDALWLYPALLHHDIFVFVLIGVCDYSLKVALYLVLPQRTE